VLGYGSPEFNSEDVLKELKAGLLILPTFDFIHGLSASVQGRGRTLFPLALI